MNIGRHEVTLEPTEVPTEQEALSHLACVRQAIEQLGDMDLESLVADDQSIFPLMQLSGSAQRLLVYVGFKQNFEQGD